MKLLSVVLLSAALGAQVPDADKSSSPTGLDLQRWKSLDLEGKWVAFDGSITTEPGQKERWVTWLTSTREFELLELMAISGGWHDPFSKGSPGAALFSVSAPQWMRVALWNLKSADSHNQSAAMQSLMSKPAQVWGWIEKYPAARKLGGENILAMIKSNKALKKPKDPGNQLPPLDPEKVLLPFLDPTRELAVFGDRTKVEKGRVYRHQVLRALRGVPAASRWEAKWRDKVLLLASHRDGRVRREALLTFTKFPADRVPYVQLARIFKAASEAADQQHALLALSYSNHPEANLRLHDVALKPEHRCWEVAISRLGDVGNRFTVKLLQRREESLKGDKKRRLTAMFAKVRSRKPMDVRQLLERAAFARIHHRVYAPELQRWTLDYIGTLNQANKLDKLLSNLAKGYVPSQTLRAEQTQLTKMVRAWAEKILDDQ